MQRISGHYTDKKEREVPFDVQIPSKWEELSAGQASTILEVLSYRKADKYTVAASLMSLLFDKHWHILNNLPAEQLHELMPVTNFILETRPPVKNFYQKLNLRKKVCIAPADDLSNIGFGEWCFAYQAYHYYVLTKNNLYLNKLIATLYRPVIPDLTENDPTYNGDLREPFNENLIISRERAVMEIGIRFRLSILAWFSASLNNIMQDRPNVFPMDEAGDAGSAPVPADERRTWFTVFRELLGPKWGTEEKLKFTNALFVLDGLEEQEIALKAMK